MIRRRTNPDTYVSPAHALLHNGMAVFSRLDELDNLQPPVKLTKMLLAVCVSGEISALVDLEQRHMSAGMMMAINHGRTLNDIRATPDFDGYFMLVEAARLEELIPLSAAYLNVFRSTDGPGKVVRVSNTEMESLVGMYKVLRAKMLTMNRPYNESVFNALVEALFFETLGIYTMLSERPAGVPTRSEELMARFLALIDEHYASERTVEFYARQLCLSAKHLSAAIRKVSGSNAGYWIDSKVVHEAKMMLRNTPQTVQEIASRLNFPDQSIFGKYFKRLTGQSPRAWRMSAQAR